MDGRWQETEADNQPLPDRICGGCGSSEERLLTLPGRLESIAGAWWHIPCYNESTEKDKEAATIKMQDQWDEREEKWHKRKNKHCNGGPGSEEHAAKTLQKIGPVKYAKYLRKLERERGKAKLKRARMREQHLGR